MINKLVQSSTAIKTKTLLLLSLTLLFSACDNDNQSITKIDPLPTQETELVSVEAPSTEALPEKSPVTEEELDTLIYENKKLLERIKQLRAELEKNSTKDATN